MASHLVNGSPPVANRTSREESHGPCEPRDKDIFEPVAIVGLSFEFPQEASSSDAFWDLLTNKRNTATEFPESRLSISNIYHPDQNRKGQISVRSGHFLREDIAAFDAPFFSISSSDAALIDPQQRKLLECTYKALENAGMPLELCAGSKTSVYIGAFTNDWQHLSFKDSEECGTTAALGVQPCLNANRISWFYNFKGNSANIDTACSSSLVALDLGCKGLRNGETNMSIVGGSSLIFSPDYLHSLSNMNMLSPDGECYSFDHRATGYGRGEGIGVLVLKRLSDALRDQDTIRAVLRNTGCNQDGNTPGITQPSRAAQVTLIKETYSRAGLSMVPTRYFEAHGTGTAVGDPTETNALGTAFSKARTLEDPLWVGAVKSNIGHLEGCSGIASVIKTIMVLERGIIPPNTNFETVNPKIDTEFLQIKVLLTKWDLGSCTVFDGRSQFPLEPVAWPCSGLRRASVNSFGYGGTNAHAILDDALHYLEEHGLSGHHTTVLDPQTSYQYSQSISTSNLSRMPSGHNSEDLPQIPKILYFSAHNDLGIKRQISEYKSHFAKLATPYDQIEAYMDNLVYTLDRRRASLGWRSFAVVESLHDLHRLDEIVSPAQTAVSKPALGFVFTGQGAQWAGMGRELTRFPAYVKSLQSAEGYLTEIGCPWLLREELSKQGEHSSISLPDYSQPICTAVQIALIDLLSDFGIQPTAVVGHSSGEIAAAYSFGAISAQAALKIAYFRGVVSSRLMKDESRQGGMLSVGLSQADMQPYLDGIASQFRVCDLAIACINSCKNVTISGNVAQIDALKAVMEGKKIFARRLLIDVAYHSPHMQQVANSYRSMIEVIDIGEAPSKSKTMVSSVTGNRVTAEELQSPNYWVANMVSPVKFAEAMSCLVGKTTQNFRKKLDLSHRYRLNFNMLVEVGPHSALQAPIRDMLTELRRSSNISYTSILRRKTSALESTLGAVGEMKCLGCPIDLVNICVPKEKDHSNLMVLPNLPGYRFDHSRSYWYESRLSNRFRTQRLGKLDLLGKPVSDWNSLEARWRNHLRVAEMPWMEDHVINGATIYPGAGMLVMAIEAAHQMADRSRVITGFELKDVHFMEPLNIPQDLAGLETHFSLHLSNETSASVIKWSEFRLCTYEKEQWKECCRGFVRVEYAMEHGEIDQGREASEEHKACRDIEAGMTKSCQEPVDTEFFYRNLHKSGFDIGPAFQRIYNAAFGTKQQAKGNIKIFEWPGAEYPQTHIIHPTTLDAILQMSVTVLTQGGRKAVQTMVPSSVSYLRVSKDGLSYPGASSVKGCVWMTASDNRGAEFDHTILDETGSCALAQVNGMRLTIIAGSATSDQDNEDQEQMAAFHVEYKPNLDLLVAGQQHSCSKSAELSLEDYLKLLIHKYPGLKVAEVGADSGKTVETELLDAVSSKDGSRGDWSSQIRSYCYMSKSQSALVHVRDRYGHHASVSFELLDIEMDPEEQGFKAESYDVLFAPKPSWQDGRNEVVIKHMLKLLKANGWLLFSEAPGSLGNTSRRSRHWREELASYGLSSLTSKLPLSVLKTSESVALLQKSSIPVDPARPPRIKRVILTIEPASGLQARLAVEISASLSAQNIDCCIEIHNLREASNVKIKNGVLFIVLLELDQPFIYTISEKVYSDVQHFLISAHDILWIGTSEEQQPRKPEYAAIDGLARVLRSERDDYRFTTVSLESREHFTQRQLQSILQVLDKNHFNPDPDPSQDEPEYIEMNGSLNIPRLIRHETLSQELQARSMPQRSGLKSIQDAPPLRLAIESPGLLDTLHFVEDKECSKPLAEGEVEVRTRAIGVNFKDCLVALGQVSGSSFGLECAGTVTRVGERTELKPGDRVAIAAEGSFKTLARGASSAACKIPEGMSFVEGAAIPAQFGTAWAIICHMARLQAGESILIHAAAGGTGQACIQIAQYLGATVIATVGSLDKKRILIEEYSIADDHIFDSRNVSFAVGVKRVTKGRGVDVVINTLVDEGMIASWECIAPYGRFVEIGKKDIAANSKLPMASFAKNAAFIGFDFSTLRRERPLVAKRDLEVLMEMFAKKQLHLQRPLHVDSVSSFKEVFRLLSSGRSAGKHVLEVSQIAQVPTTLDTTAGSSLDPYATYVIAGGLGGLGRVTARWMVDRNARNLILLSRSGVKRENARVFLEELERDGVRVEAPACDITDTEVMRQVLGSLVKEMPPIKGCVQASMVSRDGLFENMTFHDWQSGVACKTIGSCNLHAILPHGMDFFILLSSASGLAGLRGQANYNAGNTYQDAFARYRVATCGAKTISLNLGAMVDDGILAENPDALQRVLTYGVLHPITRSRFFGILDYYCDPKLAFPTVNESQMAIGIGTRAGKDGGLDGINLGRHPMFRHLVHESKVAAALSNRGKTDQAQNDERYFRSLFSESPSLPEAANIIIGALVRKLAKTLPTLPQRMEDVDTSRPIQSYSVDSLLAVELRNWIKKELKAEVAIFETQGASTFATLGRIVAERSTLAHAGWSL